MKRILKCPLVIVILAILVMPVYACINKRAEPESDVTSSQTISKEDEKDESSIVLEHTYTPVEVYNVIYYPTKSIKKIPLDSRVNDEPSLPDDFVFYKQYYDKRTAAFEDVKMPLEWQLFLYYQAQKYGLEYELVLAITGAETGFDAEYGISKNGLYYGAGMVKIEYGLKLDLENDFLTPAGGLEAVCQILSQKFKTYNGRLNRSIMAYNMGNGGMISYMRSTGNLTSGYSRRVLEIREGLYQYLYIKES